jgi:O-antigen ligase
VKRSAWGLAALAFGTAFGAAIGFENNAAILLLCVVLVAVIGVVVFSSSGYSPANRQHALVGADAEIDIPAPIEETAESNDPIRRALFAGTVATMLIVAADAQGYTLGRPSSARYLLLGVPVFALLCGTAVTANRSRLAKTTVADRFLLVYGLCGLFGSIFGRAFLHTPDSGTVIFLPMCLGLAHLMVRKPMTAREAKGFQTWLVRVGVVFLVFGILSQTPLWPLVAPRPSSFERTYFIAWAIAAAWLARRRGAIVLLVALSAVLFLQYPAATWVIVAAVSFTTAYATSRRGRRSGGAVLLVFAISMVGVGFAQIQGGGSSIATSYFSSVGKTNNTRARTQLWQAAEIEIRKSPWVGSLWAKNFTVPNRNQAITIYSATVNIEPHNDYLEALVLGGFVGLFLFVGLIISTNVVVIRRVRQLTDAGAVAQRDLARILLIGFNAALAAAMFNPELSKPGTTAVVFLVYAVMMTIRPDAGLPEVATDDQVRALRPASIARLETHGADAFQTRVLFGSDAPPES